MAKEKSNLKLTDFLRAGKLISQSHFLVLIVFIFAVAVAGLVGTGGVGICQHNFHEKHSGSVVFTNEIRCNDMDVEVRSPDHLDALIACEGARDAMVFLGSHGLEVTGNIVIELLTELPAVVSSSAAGCYIESERRVLILVYSEFRKFETWFEIPIDRSLYRSLVSHEVAHLVADYNFKVSKPTIQAKEYIAYITQFSTMEPVLRERVLSQFPCGAFEDDPQMRSTIYMFDCMSFGVRAYRHFLKQTNGSDYLHKILTGKALVE